MAEKHSVTKLFLNNGKGAPYISFRKLMYMLGMIFLLSVNYT